MTDDVDWKKLIPQQTTVSRADFEFLWQQINNPPEPSPNLRKLLQGESIDRSTDGERNTVPRRPPSADLGGHTGRKKPNTPNDPYGKVS